jgi:hypothetical protein
MRTNLDCGWNKCKTQKMKNKILIVAALAIASATLLVGCISVNVNKTAPDNSGSTTNTVAPPATK